MRYLQNVFLVTLLATLLVMAGCGNSAPAPDPAAEQKPAQTRIITDHMGRQVEVPATPERVIALNPLMAQTLFALGVAPVAVPEDYKKFHPESDNLPSTGLQQSPNIEIIHQLKPDLIFAHIRNDAQLLDSLEATGAAVVYYDPGAGENPDPLLEIVGFFGHVLNRENEAAEYQRKIDDISADLRREVAACSLKSALVLKHGEGILAAQPGTYYGGLVARLGLENIIPADLPGSTKEIFLQFDFETIAEKDPDIILLLVEGKSLQDQTNILARYKNDPKWKELTAAKNNRMVIIPGDVGPGRISIEDALQTIAGLICEDR